MLSCLASSTQVLHSKKLPDEGEYPEEGLRPVPALPPVAGATSHRFSAAALAQEQAEAAEAREREVSSTN